MSLAQTDYTAADGRDCRGCLHVRVDIDTGWLVCQEPVVALLPSDRADEPATLLWTATTAADVYAEIRRRRGTAVADRCVIRPIGDVLREFGR